MYCNNLTQVRPPGKRRNGGVEMDLENTLSQSNETLFSQWLLGERNGGNWFLWCRENRLLPKEKCFTENFPNYHKVVQILLSQSSFASPCPPFQECLPVSIGLPCCLSYLLSDIQNYFLLLPCLTFCLPFCIIFKEF